MKNIFKNWMGILTICLCVGAIAVGVLSLTSKVPILGGQIGFIPHDIDTNVELTVSATMYGHSSDGTPEGLPVAPDQAVDLGTATFGSNGVGALSLSPNGETRYFTDVTSIGLAPDDIVVTLSITNNSDVAVQLQLDTINSSLPTGVTVTLAPEEAKLDASATLEYNLTLSCTGTSGSNISAPTTDNLNVSLKVSECIGIFLSDIKSDIIQNTNDGLYVADTLATYYYIEMGINPYTQEPLRWVPIAKYDTTEQTYKQHQKTTAITEAGTYYFVSEYMLDVESASNYGISYNFYDYSTYSDTDTPAVYYNGNDVSTLTSYPEPTINASEGTLVHTNDYSLSNMRAYLNSDANNPAYRTYSGNTASAGSASNYYPATTTAKTGDTSFLSYFKISTDPVYSQITARPLSGAQNGATFSLYSDMGVTTGTTTKTAKDFYSTTKTINGVNITTQATDADKLWCLSYYEAYNYLGSTNTLRTTHKLPTTSLDTGDDTFAGVTGSWWLRSPHSSSAYYAYGVSTNGSLIYIIVFSTIGARPAFQIQISE